MTFLAVEIPGWRMCLLLGMWKCAPRQDLLVTNELNGGLTIGVYRVWEIDGVGVNSFRVNSEIGFGVPGGWEKGKLCLLATRKE